MDGPDVYGPIDVVVIEFPRRTAGSETAAALLALVERGIVRLLDVLVVRKDDDGRCAEVQPGSAADGDLAAWSRFTGARSGLLGDDDVQLATDVLDAGTVAAVILYENAWAESFVAAARAEGGEMVASARLSAQQIMDALDAAELAS